MIKRSCRYAFFPQFLSLNLILNVDYFRYGALILNQKMNTGVLSRLFNCNGALHLKYYSEFFLPLAQTPISSLNYCECNSFYILTYFTGGSSGSRGLNLLIYSDGRKINLGGKASVKVNAGVSSTL